MTRHCSHHVETSQLICIANQLAGFYLLGRLVVNPIHATGLFLYPLKTSESLWFSDVFRGHKKRPVATNGLMR